MQNPKIKYPLFGYSPSTKGDYYGTLCRASPGSDEGGYEGGHEAAAHEAPIIAGVNYHSVTGRESQGPAQPECEGHRLKRNSSSKLSDYL